MGEHAFDGCESLVQIVLHPHINLQNLGISPNVEIIRNSQCFPSCVIQ